jgi:hypothetical protein
MRIRDCVGPSNLNLGKQVVKGLITQSRAATAKKASLLNADIQCFQRTMIFGGNERPQTLIGCLSNIDALSHLW